MAKFKLPDEVKKTITDKWNLLEGGPGLARTGFKSAKAAFDFIASITDIENETDVALVVGMMVRDSDKPEEFIKAFEDKFLNAK